MMTITRKANGRAQAQEDHFGLAGELEPQSSSLELKGIPRDLMAHPGSVLDHGLQLVREHWEVKVRHIICCRVHYLHSSSFRGAHLVTGTMNGWNGAGGRIRCI
jgi:hypothetical protein